MRKLFKFFPISLLFFLILTSCSTITKISNSIFHKEVKFSDSTAHVKKDSTGTKITVTHEKIDTTIKTKADTLTKTLTLKDFLDGKDIDTSNGFECVALHYNKHTGNVTATAISKPITNHVFIDKTVTTSENSHVKTDTKIEDKKNETVTDKSKSTETVIKKGFNFWWLLLLLIPIVYFAWRKFGIPL